MPTLVYLGNLKLSSPKLKQATVSFRFGDPQVIASFYMDSPPIVDTHEQCNLINNLNLSDIDLLLFYIAQMALKMGGHRYGSFLDAATTAAKFAVYMSYLEHSHSLNKTGLLHHIEPKRVKEIVREVEVMLSQEKGHSGLGNQEPEFLIGIPSLWIEHYPWVDTGSPLTIEGLSPQEIADITSQLPQNRPSAKIISAIEFFELLDLMHQIAHQQTPLAKHKPFSNALREHYMFKILHSGMVIKLRQSCLDVDLYALVRMSYSPRQLSARLNTLFSDLVHTVELLQLWVHNAPVVLRALETLDIKPEDQPKALAELDQLLRNWADKYHDEAGTSVMLQLAAGPHPLP